MIRMANMMYDMTPTEPFYLIGYGERFQSRKEPAQGVHDPIYANVLLLEIDKEEIYIFNVDFIELEEEFCNEMREQLAQKYRCKQEHILLSVTHNHQSVRDYHRTWKSGKYNPNYETFLKQTILDGYETCRKKLTEVQIRYGSKIVTGYYGNRNHKGQLADNEVIKVEFVKDGNVLAGIINWAVHSTVLSPENALLTAEFAGNVRKYYAQKAGYTPLMVVGAAADCSTRLYNQNKNFEELDRVSFGMAEEILKIEADKPIVAKYIGTASASYRIAYDMKTQYDNIRSELEKCEIAIAENKKLEHQISPGFYKKCLKEKLEIEQVDITLTSDILKMGDIKIVTIPGELASKFGIEIKKKSDSACTLLFGYTNGFLHYMMPKEEYGNSMETIESLYPAGSIEKYVQMIEERLN